MFLKSVKARGFKSFAKPVEFGFEPGITVIVGPNGSGKSNIADAVTWAMGEQSPSVVRGGSMQDVIFSGSDRLAPAGMAEVEILLDNSSGLLPIEFSEVLISRRLYRGGEGAYFINRSPCRLIDVMELLSDTGLGRSSHSIISQGKVDAILESSPLERRAYIEEAAGLGKYKKRRHRAELKLAAVERNLERLADVEEELKVNLRPLKRQATAAERSARLDEQAALAEGSVIRGHSALLQDELRGAESAARDAGVNRVRLQEELAATAGERRRTEEMLAGSLKQHKELAGRYYGIRSQRESLAQRRESAARRLEMLMQAARRSAARIENLRGQITQSREECARAESEQQEGAGRLKQIEEELAAHQAELDGVEKEIARRRQASEEKSRRTGELDALRSRYGHQDEYLTQRHQKLAAAIERTSLELGEKQRELETLKASGAAEAGKIADWRRDEAAAAAALAGAERRRDEVRQQQESAASELRRVGEDLQIAKARLTFIADSDRDRSALPEAARSLCDEHRVQSLLDLVDVESGYERAVSAVLGSTLFALAVRDMDHARELLKAARAANQGAVEFILPEAAAPAPATGGDRLLGHVKITAEWQRHIAPLLAGVRVAADEDAIPEDSRDPWVTLEGVVYQPGRRLLSYKAEPPSSVVLKNRNERRQLEDERTAVEERHVELERRLAAITGSLEDAESGRGEAEQAFAGIRRRVKEAEEGMAASERRQLVLEQEADMRSRSLDELREEADRLQEELAETGRRLAETEKALAEFWAQGGGEEAASDENLAARELQLSSRVTELQIAAAQVRERERAASRTIERMVPARARLEDELKAAIGQRDACGQLQPAVEGFLQRAERLQGHYEKAEGGLTDQLKEGEDKAESHSAKLKELSLAEASLQQELSRASDSNTACEVSAAKLRDQLAEMGARLKKLVERHPEAGIEEAAVLPPEALPEAEEQVERLKRRREAIGPVNPLAQQEYEEMLERQRFMEEQRADLEKSMKELSGLIRELTGRIESNFSATFAAVQSNFADVVSTLFPGGEGQLKLAEADRPAAGTGRAGGEEEAAAEAADEDTADRPAEQLGIEIAVKPARKALRSLSLLSGGERSLVAVAFLFAIFLARPAPFYILDEVEAALDDANIDRLLAMFRRFQDRTQFIVITHQKRTMEVADVLYGVSMSADGTSRVLSRRMPDGPGDGAVDSEPAGKEPAAVA